MRTTDHRVGAGVEAFVPADPSERLMVQMDEVVQVQAEGVEHVDHDLDEVSGVES